MKDTPKSHPMIFSGWKVRAILDGATMTRRIIKPQPTGGDDPHGVDKWNIS